MNTPNTTVAALAAATKRQDELTKLKADVVRLREALIESEERFISCISHIEGPCSFNVAEAGSYIALIKVFKDGGHVRCFQKIKPVELKDGESLGYPCPEWKEWMAGKEQWPIIPFRSFEEYEQWRPARALEETKP